jgi:hypothetical protein
MKRLQPANPFKRKRRANQTARYLNKRQREMNRDHYDRAGNSTYISIRDLGK